MEFPFTAFVTPSDAVKTGDRSSTVAIEFGKSTALIRTSRRSLVMVTWLILMQVIATPTDDSQPHDAIDQPTSASEVAAHPAPSPTYGGRTLAQWATLIQSDREPETRLRSALALASLAEESNAALMLETALDAMKRESVPIVRSTCYMAILTLGDRSGRTDQVLELLGDAIESEHATERKLALHALSDYFSPLPAPLGGDLSPLPSTKDLSPGSKLPAELGIVLLECVRDQTRPEMDRIVAVTALGGALRVANEPLLVESIREVIPSLLRKSSAEFGCHIISLIPDLGQSAAPLVPLLIDISKRNEAPFQTTMNRSNRTGGLISRPMLAIAPSTFERGVPRKRGQVPKMRSTLRAIWFLVPDPFSARQTQPKD